MDNEDRISTPVETRSGRLRGLRGPRAGSALSFRGIPYAADTSGANRFVAPKPVPAWTGVHDAFALGDRCPQLPENLVKIPAFAWYGESTGFSENCCVLNVFTPDLDPQARRPVMVYLHGGGYWSGGSGSPASDGSELAAFGDVVVVTLNHRLNVFGHTDFAGQGATDFPDACHVGQLDIVAALQWVQDNIRAFGGDPDNVTLFGQSGGGGKVLVAMMMPAARGLFHRAINMSGATGLRLVRSADVAPYVRELLKALGVDARDVRRLQDVPADVLVAARAKAMAAARMEGAHPVIDGRHVLASPFDPEGIALQSSVPLMMGTTGTEATLFLGNNRANFAIGEAQLKARVQAQFGMNAAEADAMIAAYRTDDPGRSAADLLASLASDILARGAMIRCVEAKASAPGAPVYLYHLAWRSPVEGGVWRSPHTIDIPLVFGTLEAAPALIGDASAARGVSHDIMSAFVAFARTGDPNNARLPAWKPYDMATRATMVFDTESRAVNDYEGAQRIACTPHIAEVPIALMRGPLFRGVPD
ncbi:carboxylesterase/lipase family protein [Ramlibacter sp.]|uniref:carboxylesterase/lipase family protein n=1 Tax=Ramlibacter sp. TaxID=1917967 RepID=UPI003D09BCC3